MAIKFEYCDGGRSLEGWKGSTGDCVTRAISIATKIPYGEVYCEINQLTEKLYRKHKSSARTGVHKNIYHDYILSKGFVWTATMKIGSGCKVHVKEDELPTGVLILSLSKHLVACIDRVIYDTHDPSRGGTRCVYGYYKKEGG